MANFNKVLLMGNLTRDPQLTYTPNQTAVVEFGLAVNRRWTGQDGSNREDVCFVDCQAFGRLAENINKYMKKGRSLFVEGRLTLDSWTAKDGTKRSKHKITVENCQFLGAPGGANAGQAEQSGSDVNSQAQAGPQEESGGKADDIPF